MTNLIPLALFGWVPVSVGLFGLLPPRRAAIACLVGGWLVLPSTYYPLQGLPDLTKTSAIFLGIFVGLLAFDHRRLSDLRPRWIDLPIGAWCVSPLASSLANGLGGYDGLSAIFDRAIHWGAPYLLGRLYFASLAGLRELALGLLVGGLAYVPLCLYEIVEGPNLHKYVYGFHQQALRQAYRYGGWRPAVFLQHGLAVGVWMATATLTAFWLWITGAVKNVGWTVPILFFTTLLVKSVNAWLLLATGGVSLWLVRRYQSRFLVLFLVLVTPTYVLSRATQTWQGKPLIPVVAKTFGSRRAISIWYRLRNEDLGVRKALSRPVFGWGRWGRAFVWSEHEERDLPFDSLWMLALGESGFVGLFSLLGVLIAPALAFWSRHPVRRWAEPGTAPAAVLAMILVIYAIDNCFNAHVNPFYMVAAGGLCTVGGGARNHSVSTRMA